MSESRYAPSPETLYGMSYRELQQIAKPLGVPCNIKKVYLQEVIYQSYYGTQTEVAHLVERALSERRLNPNPRRRDRRNQRKGVQRKITPPKDKWVTLMANGSSQMTPVRLLKLRTPYKADRDIALRVLKLGSAMKRELRNCNFGISNSGTQKTVKKYARHNSSARKHSNGSIVPCDRILRSNIFPICDKLERRRSLQRADEDLVSSSQDFVDSHSVLREFLELPSDYRRNELAVTSMQPHVEAFATKHDYDKPVDFSVKKTNEITPQNDYNTRCYQTNLTLQSMLQYQAIDSNSHSTVVTYETVTQTGNYQPMDNISATESAQITLYAGSDEVRGKIQNGNMYTQLGSSYVDYSRSYQLPIDSCDYTGQAYYEDPENFAAAACTPPYFHKKIRIDRRRISCRDVDQRNADNFLFDPSKPEEHFYETLARSHGRNTAAHDAAVAAGFAGGDVVSVADAYTHSNEINNNLAPNKTPDFSVNNIDIVTNDNTDHFDDSSSPAPGGQENDDLARDDSTGNVYSSYGNTLPKISEVFPKYCASTQTYMRPLFVHIDNERGSSGDSLDGGDINSNVVDLNSEMLLKLHETSAASLVTPPSPQSMQYLARMETSPKGSEADVADLETIVSQMNSPWSDMEVGASVTVRAPSPVGSWDDVMGIISQEESTMDVENVQCVCCDWNGLPSLLEQHLEQCHSTEVHTYDSRLAFTHGLSLGALLRSRRQTRLVRWHGALYVLLVKYEDPECLLATFAMLSQHQDTPPLQSTVTVYNKLTGEPFSWSAPVLKSNLVSRDPATHLKMRLSRLGLLADGEEVLLWNGQVPVSPLVKTMCGELSLDEINLEFYVELSC